MASQLYSEARSNFIPQANPTGQASAQPIERHQKNRTAILYR
jgi:hypothetical protein